MLWFELQWNLKTILCQKSDLTILRCPHFRVFGTAKGALFIEVSSFQGLEANTRVFGTVKGALFIELSSFQGLEADTCMSIWDGKRRPVY